MACAQSSTLVSSGVTRTPNSGAFSTLADCLNACKEGACCDGATCSIKPRCQCQGAGQTFKGIGVSCTDSMCLPCGCASPGLQSIVITTGSPSNGNTAQDVFSSVIAVLGSKSFSLAYFRSSVATFEHTNNVQKLYSLSSGKNGNFSGQQSELDAMQVGDVVWRSLATCPGQSDGMAISDVWAKVSVGGFVYVIKWGTRNLYFSSCTGGTVTASFTGSVFTASSGGSDATYFGISATAVIT